MLKQKNLLHEAGIIDFVYYSIIIKKKNLKFIFGLIIYNYIILMIKLLRVFSIVQLIFIILTYAKFDIQINYFFFIANF